MPLLVLGPALAALAVAGTDRRGWAAALVGACLYAQGHGVHLAANSIGNARGDGAPVHLWDEVVGHALWYGGLAVVVAAVARAVAATPLRAGPAAVVLALLTGGTWTTNALGADGLVLPAALAALGLAAQGVVLRESGAGRLLVWGFLPPAAVLLVAAAA